MTMLLRLSLLFAGLVLLAGGASGACIPLNNERQPVQDNRDPLARLLASSDTCPVDVFGLRSLILKAGGKIDTSLIDNEGFNNGDQGNFSMFEIVSGRLDPLTITLEPGEFFFGHFTDRSDSTLIANQTPEEGNLMIELISWDPPKGVFNFYELIGDGQKGEWFYRGNSLDVLADIKLLHRQPNPATPQFGTHLRCSGCHSAGGPVMKELATPHNDWSRTARPLAFGDLQLDPALSKIFLGMVDADKLAAAVMSGSSKLQTSEKFQEAGQAASLQEQLRPLFCPVELNLESDLVPSDDPQAPVIVPSAFFVDPRLARTSPQISRADYNAALTKLKSQFPGKKHRDADHAWLTPVKASSDIQTIDGLVSRKIIDQKFVYDVLAVDLTNPAFSKARCGLLRLLPTDRQGDWLAAFVANLKASSEPAAQELLQNMTDPARTVEFHQKQAAEVLKKCEGRFHSPDGVLDLYRLLLQRRVEAFESEISKNPKGQILEPGFKVVFPCDPGTPAAAASRLCPKPRGQARPELRLTSDCVIASVSP
jgi:hypothetical protein